MTLTVRTTQRSPFGQKVINAAKMLGIAAQLDVQDTQFLDPADPIRVENPLGKMPVLTTEDGEYIYDSAVIVEYLNQRFNGNLIPTDPDERIRIKTIEALSDGITDAGVMIVVEGMFREANMRSAKWLDHQRGKMDRGFARLRELELDPTEQNIATLSIGCLLRWLKIRQIYDLGEHLAYFDDWLAQFEATLHD